MQVMLLCSNDDHNYLLIKHLELEEEGQLSLPLVPVSPNSIASVQALYINVQPS